MLKLFLDDLRTAPNDTWTTVRTADEAIEWLSRGIVAIASLDHDLADGHYPWVAGFPYPENEELVKRTKEKTGYDVVCFMEEHNIWPKSGVRVHSQNPVGVARMLVPIEKHYGRNFQF